MRASIAIGVAALVLAAAAAAAPVGAPPQLVAGAGSWLGAGTGLSSFSAGTAINPGGGEFRIDAHGFFSGRLETTCFALSGKRAVLIGQLRQPIEAFGQTWDYAGLYVEDNGPPSGPTPDRVTAFVSFGPLGCRRLFDFGAAFAQPLVTGNAVVQDGSATNDVGTPGSVAALH